MASFRMLLAAAAAIATAAAAALPAPPVPATIYPRGTGRLTSLGYTHTTGSKLPYSNTFRDDEATDDQTLILDWHRDVPSAEIEAITSWIQTSMQKRNLAKRGASYQYVKSHNISNSWYSRVDMTDMDDDIILQIMDRQELASADRNVRAHTTTLFDQTNATPGLIRLSNPGPGGTEFIFDQTAGEGITVYVIDTGINTNHTEFTGARATWGANFVPDSPDTDQNGHGTHVAGTVGGRTFGVAKNAHLVAVKVLNEEGSGSFADIIAGMEWVANQVEANGQASKSIASMSIGGPAADSINNAVEDLTNAGVVVTVAAGNDNVEATTSSPASAPAAITIGAIDASDDSKAPFSNFGSALDIWAPGVDILSSFIGSDIATTVLSGTSMATPHVAGLCAYLMSLEGISGPQALVARLQALAKATGAQVVGNTADSINLIAYNGVNRT